MSEHQYYEFRAIDRPLTKEEMAEPPGLRKLSPALKTLVEFLWLEDDLLTVPDPRHDRAVFDFELVRVNVVGNPPLR